MDPFSYRNLVFQYSSLFQQCIILSWSHACLLANGLLVLDRGHHAYKSPRRVNASTRVRGAHRDHLTFSELSRPPLFQSSFGFEHLRPNIAFISLKTFTCNPMAETSCEYRHPVCRTCTDGSRRPEFPQRMRARALGRRAQTQQRDRGEVEDRE